MEPRTDEPERRFVVGSSLDTEAPTGAPVLSGRPETLRLEAVRWHQDRLLVRFAGVGDRTAAESLRGLVLLVDVDTAESPEDPEEFYDHQLVGLRVQTTQGDLVGEIASVQHGAAQDLLVVRRPVGEQALVPFVTALVPRVDLDAGLVEVADRPGLLSGLDED